MLRLAILLWVLIGTTLAGTLVLAVVAVPSLSDQGMRLIPWAGAAGFLLGVPAAAYVARAILAATRSPA